MSPYNEQAVELSTTTSVPSGSLESGKAPKPRFYKPELDVLRFVAFLSVFTVHALSLRPGIIPGWRIVAPVGAYGLCLFFFLSSFLITELLTREEESTGRIHVQAFYLRRILRIWPLYFGFLLFGKILGHYVPFFGLEWPRLAAFLLLAGNWFMAWHGSTWSPVEPLWSISVEEQFYLAWPLVAKFGGKRAIGIFSAALLPVAWIALYWHSGYQPAAMGLEFDGTLWCNSLIQFQYFALGALFSLGLRGRTPRWGPFLRVLIFAFGFALWFAASWLFRQDHVHRSLTGAAALEGYSLIGAGCACLFLSLLGARLEKMPKSVIYLGKISYGLYVFHWLCLELFYLLPLVLAGKREPPHTSLMTFTAEYILVLAATILIAILSYRFFESPFLKLKKRFTFVTGRAV